MEFSEITNFSSFSFLIYGIFSFILFWFSPQKLKQGILLIISYLFYSSLHVSHLIILLTTTLIDFYFGKIIYNRRKNAESTAFFVFVCLATNLGILIFFKYRFFLFSSFIDTKHSLVLPLGLSFFTLQSIGYILDISRGKLIPEKNIITYALFVSFFPQIIAGPIEKAQDILYQYKKNFSFNSIQWTTAFYLFAYGFFKKYVVADNLASALAQINITSDSSLTLRFITLFYFFIRIYCDFSGYTNMARAIAMLFTINLRENFNFPLFANSPQDFWDRWHMSLGYWIKSYFYTPLLIQLSNPYLAILIIFPIMGLWHGANINFILWGFSWAILIIIYKKYQLGKKISSNFLKIFLMLNISTLLMVFYKVRDFAELNAYLTINFSKKILWSNYQENLILKVALLPFFILIYEFYLFKKNDAYYLITKSFFIQSLFYILIFIVYCNFLILEPAQFFYLQF